MANFSYVGIVQPDDRRLWRVTHNDEQHYVLTHADYGITKVFLWACDAQGVVTDWTELPGTEENSVNQKQAILDYVASLSL